VSRVTFTERAREDLINIWLYVAAQNSEAVADRIYHSIQHSRRLLTDHPQLGRARPEILPEARSLVIERWLAPLSRHGGRTEDRAHHRRCARPFRH